MCPLCPRFEFIAEGERYRLVNSLEAWFLYEARTGLQVGDTAGSMRNLRTLLWALLQPEHPSVPEEALGNWHQGSIAAAMLTAGLALQSAVPDKPVPAKAEQIRKPTDWYQLWAIGRFDLGLSDEEFWKLHPLQFHHLSERFDAQVDREFYGHCITAAMIRNCHVDLEKTAPLDPMALMPTASGERARREATAQHSAGLLSKIRQLKEFFPGAKVNI